MPVSVSRPHRGIHPHHTGYDRETDSLRIALAAWILVLSALSIALVML